MYARTPMGSEHDGRTYATGRRRVEIEWDDHDLKSMTVSDHLLDEAINAVLEQHGITASSIRHYDERGSWKKR